MGIINKKLKVQEKYGIRSIFSIPEGMSDEASHFYALLKRPGSHQLNPNVCFFTSGSGTSAMSNSTTS